VQPEQSGTRCTRLCADCGNELPQQKRGRPKERCTDCQKKNRRERVRSNVRAHRDAASPNKVIQTMPLPASSGGGPAQKEKTEMKSFQLECGHTVLFRQAPIIGEELPCCRCGEDQWREYTGGKHWKLCQSGQHRMTPFNIIIDPATKLHACRKCMQDELGDYIAPRGAFSGVGGGGRPRKKKINGPQTVTHPKQRRAHPSETDSAEMDRASV
jgi:CDGSH-type Zn-finger protein